MLNPAETLTYQSVKLLPLTAAHQESLTRLASDPAIWQTHREPFYLAEHFSTHWFDKAMQAMTAGKRITYVLS